LTARAHAKKEIKMQKDDNPDYVDRCVDKISDIGSRCIADLAVIGVVLIGLILASSVKELDAEPSSYSAALQLAPAVECGRTAFKYDYTRAGKRWLLASNDGRQPVGIAGSSI
jgi:hypothetical protein